MKATIQKLEAELNEEVLRNEQQRQLYTSLEKEHKNCKENIDMLRYFVKKF